MPAFKVFREQRWYAGLSIVIPFRTRTESGKLDHLTIHLLFAILARFSGSKARMQDCFGILHSCDKELLDSCTVLMRQMIRKAHIRGGLGEAFATLLACSFSSFCWVKLLFFGPVLDLISTHFSSEIRHSLPFDVLLSRALRGSFFWTATAPHESVYKRKPQNILF